MKHLAVITVLALSVFSISARADDAKTLALTQEHAKSLYEILSSSSDPYAPSAQCSQEKASSPILCTLDYETVLPGVDFSVALSESFAKAGAKNIGFSKEETLYTVESLSCSKIEDVYECKAIPVEHIAG